MGCAPYCFGSSTRRSAAGVPRRTFGGWDTLLPMPKHRRQRAESQQDLVRRIRSVLRLTTADLGRATEISHAALRAWLAPTTSAKHRPMPRSMRNYFRIIAEHPELLALPLPRTETDARQRPVKPNAAGKARS
jgi:DNA-binding transcriptional regulator YiaG